MGDDESKVLFHELKIIRAEHTKRINAENAKLAGQFLKLQQSKKVKVRTAENESIWTCFNCVQNISSVIDDHSLKKALLAWHRLFVVPLPQC